MTEAAEQPAVSSNRSIARNSLLLGVGDALAMLFGFFTTLIVIDRLGDQYGAFIGAQRFVMMFLVIAELGLTPLLVRSVAMRHEDAGVLVGTVLSMRAVLCLLYVAVVATGALAIDYLPEHRPLVYAFAALNVLTVLASTLTGLFEGLERMGRSALVTFARSATVLALVVAVLVMGGGLREVVAAYLVGSAVQLGASIVLSVPLLRSGGLRVDWSRIAPLVREAGLFVLVGMSFTALRSLDVVMLTRLSDTSEVAQYGAALNFLEVMLVVPLLVQRALLPAFSRLHLSGQAAETIRDTLTIFSAVLTPSAVGLSLLADKVVALYPSGEFAAAAPILRVLALALMALGPSTVCATYLTGVGRLGLLLATYGVVLPAQVAANFLLIPASGADGLAFATLGAHVLLALLLLATVRFMGLRLPVAAFARHLLAAAAMAGVVWLVKDFPLPVPLLSGVLLYGAALALLAGPESPERRIVAALRERREDGA